MNFKDLPLKSDQRPPKNGWCKGNYFGKCHSCKKEYMGDKRSITCADCAYDVKLYPEQIEMFKED